MLISWILACALLGALLPILPALFMYLLTVSLFPPAGWLMIKTQAKLLRNV